MKSFQINLTISECLGDWTRSEWWECILYWRADIWISRNHKTFLILSSFNSDNFLLEAFRFIFKKLDWWFSFAGINKTKLLIDLQSQPPSIILYCSWKHSRWIALNFLHFSVPMLSVETVLGMMTNLPCNITPSVPGDQVYSIKSFYERELFLQN